MSVPSQLRSTCAHACIDTADLETVPHMSDLRSPFVGANAGIIGHEPAWRRRPLDERMPRRPGRQREAFFIQAKFHECRQDGVVSVVAGAFWRGDDYCDSHSTVFAGEIVVELDDIAICAVFVVGTEVSTNRARSLSRRP